MTPQACRVDVWLWRARFVRSRTLAAELVARGGVRLTRHGRQTRIDRCAREVHPGDLLVFAIAGRLFSVRVEAPGSRRGPPAEARTLYSVIEAPGASPTGSVQASLSGPGG